MPGHRVQQRAPVEEPPCGRAAAGEPDRKRAGALGGGALRLQLVGRDEAVADAREAEAVERDRHRVRGEVAGAGSGTRTAWRSSSSSSARGNQAALLGADRLPDVLDRHFATAQPSGPHRAAVDDDGGLVDARERHQRGRRRLVAADDADERVEVVCAHHQLDRVGDHLARDQRRAHARRRLRLVVGDRDRVERERDAAGRRHAVRDAAGELELVQVARHRARPRRRDADDRAVEPRRVDAHRAEVGASRCALGSGGEGCTGAAAERVMAHATRIRCAGRCDYF